MSVCVAWLARAPASTTQLSACPAPSRWVGLPSCQHACTCRTCDYEQCLLNQECPSKHHMGKAERGAPAASIQPHAPGPLQGMTLRLQRRPGQQHSARPVQGPHPARSSQPRRPGPQQSRPRRRRSSRRRWRRCRRARPARARHRRARPAGRGWRCGSPPAARPRCQSLRPRTGPWLTTA